MALRDLFNTKPAATGRPRSASAPARDYIDLEAYQGSMDYVDNTANMLVRVAEIQRYEDLKDLANHVYQGNMLLLDFSPIASDDVILRRVTQDLKKLVDDISGDIAGLGKTMMIVAPTGVKIDRRKSRGGGY